MDHDPLQALFWRDEILQIMYWMQGEGLGTVVGALDLVAFLDASEELVRYYLERLVEEGCAAHVEGKSDRYQLTELGLQEGGRRFAEEFAELTHQGHGECDDPGCACKTLGPEACTSHVPHSHS